MKKEVIVTLNMFEQAKSLGYEIIKIGHPTLRKISQKVPDDMFGSKELIEFIDHLRQTLDTTEEFGTGLAAPQVGVNIELFITRIAKSYEDMLLLCKASPLRVWINPVYEITDPEELSGIEGCLSIPGYLGRVNRPKEIKVHAFDENGNSVSEHLPGSIARVFLHEYDHLKGEMYIDKLYTDNSGRVELYDEDYFLKVLMEEKKQNNDQEWFENRGLKMPR
jgi:peptide deformylase